MNQEIKEITRCHIICIQETKHATIDAALVGLLGGPRLNQFALKPAYVTRGGLLILWNDDYVSLDNISVGRYSISARVTPRDSLPAATSSFLLTTVYAPTRHVEKELFLQHLLSLKPESGTRLLLDGNFNLIYRANNKDNTRLNPRLMRRFRAALNFCELNEIHLQNRKFTWSNERRWLTLPRPVLLQPGLGPQLR